MDIQIKARSKFTKNGLLANEILFHPEIYPGMINRNANNIIFTEPLEKDTVEYHSMRHDPDCLAQALCKGLVGSAKTTSPEDLRNFLDFCALL